MSLLERISSHRAASASGLLQHSQRHSVQQGVRCPVQPARQCSRVVVHSSRRSDESSPHSAAPVAGEGPGQQRIAEDLSVKTRYIAETLLPTRHGKFRLRGYKHSVRLRQPRGPCSRPHQGWQGPQVFAAAVSACMPVTSCAFPCCCSLTVASLSLNPPLS